MVTPRKLWLRVWGWPVQHLPTGLLAQPFQVFLAGICVLNGVPLLVDPNYQAQSIEAQLPDWAAVLWGVELLAGGALTLYGTLRSRWRAERTGLLLLGPAAMVYAAAIVLTVGARGGGVAAGLTLAFGLACSLRAYLLRLEHLLVVSIGLETHLQAVAQKAAERAAGGA